MLRAHTLRTTMHRVKMLSTNDYSAPSWQYVRVNKANDEEH